MLISEAAELVLQAGSVGKKNNIYVLEMGDPIAIVKLAEMMIELSGLVLNNDISINITGLRPGEKLHESLMLPGEEFDTSITGVLELSSKLSVPEGFVKMAQDLVEKSLTLKRHEIIAELKKLVPEYKEPDE